MTSSSTGCLFVSEPWRSACQLLNLRVPMPADCPWPLEKSDWLDPQIYEFSRFDLIVVIALAIALTWIRAAVQRFSATRLAGGVTEIGKCSESVWKALFYAVSLSWGLLICGRRGWVWLHDYDAVFNHVPDLMRNPERIEMDLYMFYMFQMAFYTHSIHAHAFGAETKRDDFVEMLVHHVVTLGLLYTSFATRFVAGGTLIVVVHDAADLVFECAKLCIYNQRELLANIVFGIWVAVWVVTRLIYFPFYIVRGCVWENVARLGFFPTYSFNAITLLILLALHVFWTTMIVRMIVRMITGDAKRLRDTRERDTPTKKKNKKND